MKVTVITSNNLNDNTEIYDLDEEFSTFRFSNDDQYLVDKWNDDDETSVFQGFVKNIDEQILSPYIFEPTVSGETGITYIEFYIQTNVLNIYKKFKINPHKTDNEEHIYYTIDKIEEKISFKK
jgi:hypothetical protein